MHTGAQSDWAVAVLAGFFSFFSPCVLPIIPGYLSMISGLSIEQLEEGSARHQARVLVACVLFALGLCAVFIPLGLGAGAVGAWLGPRRSLLNTVFGLAVVVFGLFMMGLLKLPFLYQDRRLRLSRARTGLWAAPVMGIAFGAGWTPCFGPWVAGLTLRAANLPPGRAALLFALYGAVLGLCFVATGVLFSRAVRAFSFFQKHYRAVEIAGGALLVAMGVLMVAGKWDWAAGHLSALLDFGGTSP